MSRAATVAQGEALDLAAERLVADARAVCGRIGADQSDAITLLIHAASMAIADACGVEPDGRRVRRAVDMASDQLADAVPAYVLNRTNPGGGRRE